MIILACSNCSQTLEIDDAFAGLVCRCRYCGAIQTVPPGAARPKIRAASPVLDRLEAPPALRPVPQVPPMSPPAPRDEAAWVSRSDRLLMLTVGLAALLAVLTAGTALTLVASAPPSAPPAPAEEPPSLASLLH